MVVVGLIPTLAVAQGLGGAARQEADRRARVQGEPAEVRSYSNADLRIDEETEEAGSGKSASSLADPGPGRRVEATPDGADQDELDRLREQLDRASSRRKERERKWRARVAAARVKLAAAEREHEVACNPGSIALRGG